MIIFFANHDLEATTLLLCTVSVLKTKQNHKAKTKQNKRGNTKKLRRYLSPQYLLGSGSQAERLIDAALACELGPEQDNDVTCDCLKVRPRALVERLLLLLLLFLSADVMYKEHQTGNENLNLYPLVGKKKLASSSTVRKQLKTNIIELLIAL